MSAWGDAFTELKRAVQPDVEPTLSYGGGATADATKELDQILLSCARGVPWEASLVVTYGQIVFPATRMGRVFKVTQGGTLSSTEPSWPDYGSVTDGTATLVEDGSDFPSVYDVREAIRKAWELKLSKASVFIQIGELSNNQVFEHCQKMVDRYAPLGVA